MLTATVSTAFFQLGVNRGAMTITTEPYPRFSAEEFARRYDAVRTMMREADLPVLLLYSTISSNYLNLAQTSGRMPQERSLPKEQR